MTYSTKRGTRRWPLSLFFTVLDIVVHNSFVIWLDKYPGWSSYPNSRKSDVRRLFILELGKAFCMNWISAREVKPYTALQPSVKRAMAFVKGRPVKKAKQDTQTAAVSKGRCHTCPRNKDKKTNIRCNLCSQFVCGEHATKCCVCAADCTVDNSADN